MPADAKIARRRQHQCGEAASNWLIASLLCPFTTVQ